VNAELGSKGSKQFRREFEVGRRQLGILAVVADVPDELALAVESAAWGEEHEATLDF